MAIGYDESEQLDVEPARYFVRVTKREKRACRGCEQGTGTMARLEPRIVEKGLASDAVVINTVVAKYCDHVPLYRQAMMLEREAGLEIGRATLDGWVMRVGELLQPVIAAMRKDLLSASYLQADETTVPVQMHDKRGSNHEAYLWQYGKPGGETVFEFCLGRGREGPKKFLDKWEGMNGSSSLTVISVRWHTFSSQILEVALTTMWRTLFVSVLTIAFAMPGAGFGKKESKAQRIAESEAITAPASGVTFDVQKPVPATYEVVLDYLKRAGLLSIRLTKLSGRL